MKLFLILLVGSSIALAEVPPQLKNYPDIRLGLYLCNINMPNAAPEFLDKIKGQDLACLEQKKQEVIDMLFNDSEKEKKKNSAREAIKNFDCETLAGFEKLLCEREK